MRTLTAFGSSPALKDALARAALDVRFLTGSSGYRKFVIVGIARTGMQDEREALQMVAIGAVNVLPAFHLGGIRLHHGLRLLHLRTACLGRLAGGEALSR
jgi:hypothetical protein